MGHFFAALKGMVRYRRKRSIVYSLMLFLSFLWLLLLFYKCLHKMIQTHPKRFAHMKKLLETRFVKVYTCKLCKNYLSKKKTL